MTGEAVPGRAIWRLSGKDVLTFLQGLVTNDVLPLGHAPGLVWTAFLTAQGKYLADFFVIRRAGAPEGEVLLDLPNTPPIWCRTTAISLKWRSNG